MAIKRFIVELGYGADLHGKDVTKAACRAVKDAISRSCLCGIIELAGVRDPNKMKIRLLIGCPYPERVDKEKVAAQLPFGSVEIETVLGGLEAKGLEVVALGEGDRIVMANVALTVSLDEKDMGLKG
jgi:uncharacterized protein (TIGR02058 family)